MSTTDKKIETICNMSRSGKSNKEIAEHFCCSTGYVSKILRDNGIFGTQPMPNDEEVIASYQKTKSSNKTGKEFDINYKTVLKILHRNNIPVDGIEYYRKNAKTNFSEEKISKLSEDISEAVIDLYKETLSSYKVAKFFEINQKTVLKILHKNDISTSGPRNLRLSAERYPREIQMEIRKLYESGMTTTELKKLYGGDITTICKAIERVGGQIRPRKHRKPVKVTPEKIKEICDLFKSGLSQSEIGGRIGHAQSLISRVLINNGLRTLERKPRADNNGKYTKEGYVQIFVEQDDPMTSMRTLGGYVPEHRLVMARKIGRPLTSEETVHHINGNTLDNSPDNLQLRNGRHGKGSVQKCVDCGSENIVHLEWYQCSNCGSTKIKCTEI